MYQKTSAKHWIVNKHLNLFRILAHRLSHVLRHNVVFILCVSNMYLIYYRTTTCSVLPFIVLTRSFIFIGSYITEMQLEDMKDTIFCNISNPLRLCMPQKLNNQNRITASSQNLADIEAKSDIFCFSFVNSSYCKDFIARGLTKFAR